MEINFESAYSGVFIVLSVVLAAGISFLIYFRNADSANLSFTQRILLAFLRFFSLLFVFLLLLAPLIEHTKKVRQLPVLAVAIDNSQSVQSYSSSVGQFKEELKNRFSSGYQLDFWSFGEKVENAETFTGAERRSDYGQLIKTLKGNYINRNIGAMILLGDGIYNQGQDPANLITGTRFPVYTVGIGDTTRKVDALIRNVKTNKVAFLKNRFPVEIELNFSKLRNKIAYIDIEHNQHSVYSSTVAINSDDDFKLEFANLEAAETGMQHYKIKIRALEGEVNLKNNEYEFVIQVLENKQKILMLSDGAHPDLGAIRTSLLQLQNYDIKIVTGNMAPDSLSTYSLIVLNQLPSSKNAASQLLSKIKESHVPVLFLVGPNSMLEQLNSLDLGLKVSPGKNTEEVQPAFDKDFSLFTLSDATKEIISSSPPLLSPFGNTDLYPTVQNLALQNIRNIPTNKSMLAFGTLKGRKVGFVVGEGLWRWRLNNFKVSGNFEAFDELVQKIVQYLALKENEDNFNVYHPALFQETDNIEFTAELYNDSYQLVNTPDVSIRIKNSGSQEFSYLFDRTNDYYSLNAGNLEPGDYTFEAETQLGNQHFAEKGSFSIVRNDIELQNNQADFGVLYQLAQQTGGQFAAFENYGTLLDAIENNNQITTQQYKQSVQTEWINMKTLFFMLLLLLGTEWFLRKYWGIY